MKIIFSENIHIFQSFTDNIDLIKQFTNREITGRYKGSYLGLLWSFINPLLMLIVYTFVFGIVFKSKWGVSVSESRIEYALTLYCGIIVFNLFNECVNRAPSLIISNANYVKKVIFPLEILPIAVLGSGIVHALIGLLIICIGSLVFLGTVSWTIVLFPIVIIPLLMLTLGISWFLASLGVFIRDIGYTITIITQILFFVTPVFYPISAVPHSFQILMKLNPLTTIVESSRKVLMWGQQPDWMWVVIVYVVSTIVMHLGFSFFTRSKHAFADVI